jgi:hypothetical protein
VTLQTFPPVEQSVGVATQVLPVHVGAGVKVVPLHEADPLQSDETSHWTQPSVGSQMSPSEKQFVDDAPTQTLDVHVFAGGMNVVPLHDDAPVQSADVLHWTHPDAVLQTSPIPEQAVCAPATHTLDWQLAAAVKTPPTHDAGEQSAAELQAPHVPCNEPERMHTGATPEHPSQTPLVPQSASVFPWKQCPLAVSQQPLAQGADTEHAVTH